MLRRKRTYRHGHKGAGKGVRLYPELGPELPLKLVGTEHYNGIVDLVYEKR